jgi:hypothetical protein
VQSLHYRIACLQCSFSVNIVVNMQLCTLELLHTTCCCLSAYCSCRAAPACRTAGTLAHLPYCNTAHCGLFPSHICHSACVTAGDAAGTAAMHNWVSTAAHTTLSITCNSNTLYSCTVAHLQHHSLRSSQHLTQRASCKHIPSLCDCSTRNSL